MRRTYRRRVDEPYGRGGPAIVYYEVDYQLYRSGVRVKDGIFVTVYALSGGSDFVRSRFFEETVTAPYPCVSPLRAEKAVRTALELERSASPTAVPSIPPLAELTGIELIRWNERLEWHLSYDWPEDPHVICDHSSGGATVDAETGEVLGFGTYW